MAIAADAPPALPPRPLASIHFTPAVANDRAADPRDEPPFDSMYDDPHGGPAPVPAATVDYHTRLRKGGSFVLDTPARPPAVLGEGDQVLWAEGESLVIVGPTGTGKSTVAGQLVRGRIGLCDEVLGFPIVEGRRKVLYLAMDRPRQIARNLARMFTEEERDILDERLVFWAGPPPLDFGKHANALTDMALSAGADTVVIDSLKDGAIKLSDDEVGGTLNRGIQEALTNGIEVTALHHQRKGSNGTKPNTLEDVYGSTWITAGAGSVVLLWGAAGDPLIELIHLKQPAGEIGPLKIEHHLDGTSSIYSGFDALNFLRNRPIGATATDAARAMFGKDKPDDNKRKKAQRLLDRLVHAGLATKQDAVPGGAGGATGARYYATATETKCPT